MGRPLSRTLLILPALAAIIALMALSSCSSGGKPIDGFDYPGFETCDKSDPNDTDSLQACTLRCTKSQSDFGSRGMNLRGQPIGKRALPAE